MTGRIQHSQNAFPSAKDLIHWDQNARNETQNPEPQTLNPKHRTLNPEPWTLDPEP